MWFVSEQIPLIAEGSVTRRRVPAKIKLRGLVTGWRPAQEKVTSSTAEAPVQAAEQGMRGNEEDLRELMVRYQRAELPAVEELVFRLSPVLMRFLSGPGFSRGDTEDMLQDCWLRIHRSRATYRPTEPLLPWIFAIARHARLDGYRRRRRLGMREVLVAQLPDEVRETEPTKFLETDDFEKRLNALPESQREVILMLKVSGMTLEEVARATASTVGAIKQKAHRAYARLRASSAKEL